MAAIGFPFDVGGAAFRGAGVGGNSLLNPQLSGPGQSFINIPVPNDRQALYTLIVRDPTQPDQALGGLSYTFPLSPSSLVKTNMSNTNIYDVAGSPTSLGVQRVVDMYGDSPPMFTIEGTTGWQKHSADGFAFTGLESIAALRGLFDQFAQLNAERVKQNNAVLYVMEFYDYFQGEFWRVVPVGPQVIRQDENRPLLFYYSFKFAATEDLSVPAVDNTPDPILQSLNTPQNQATTQLSDSLSDTLTDYAPETPGALVE